MAKKEPVVYALSIKQPWAALVVAGLKSVEIRRWPTVRHGRILIHAGRIPDDRPDAWKYVQTPEVRTLAQLRGGIIGAVELTGCLSYQELDGFVADQAKHRNEPSWFEPPRMYGFTFAHPEVLTYASYPGWFRFFPVPATIEVALLVADTAHA